MSQKVLLTNDVELAILKSNPPQLSISAIGSVTTSGWTNGQLIPYVYVKPPEDGIYEFDFVADPPKDYALQVISPITASYIMEQIPDELKGVRVYSSTNNIEEKLEDDTKSVDLSGGEETGVLEVLKGISLTADSLIFRVATGGCTEKDHFKVNVDKGITGQPPYLVSIYRMVPDSCEGHFPEGVEIEVSREEYEIGHGAAFTLVNKVGDSIR